MDRTLDAHRTHRCNSMKRVVEWYTGLHWTDRWVCGEHQSSWQWGGAGHREVSKTSLVVCRCWEWQLEQGSLRLSQSPSHTSQVLVTCYGYQWQQLKSKLYQIKSCSHACKSPLLQHMRQIKSLLALFSAWEALWGFFLYALAKVTKDYMVCRRQMISDHELCDVWSQGYSFGLQFGLFSFKISVHTCKCAHTRQLKQIQEVCPHFFLKSLGLFKVVPPVRMSHWPHNGPQWQPVLRRALIAGECHSGRV